MFIGMDVCSGKYAMLPQYTNIGTTKNIQLTDGTYDHLYMSSNPEKTADNIYDEWDSDTKLNANFQDSLEGGNSGFSLKNTDTIVIKRREKNSMNWLTIFTIPVNKIDDINFIKEYNYGEAETDYDFMIISSLGGTKNAFEFTSCRCEFNGICVTDKDHYYRTAYNTEVSDITQNTNNATISLLNNTYPIVISSDDTNYTSGTISVVFLKEDNNVVIEGKPATVYRKEIINWLTNKRPKILKLDNGTTKMVRIVGNPIETYNGYSEIKNIQFEFVEIGNTESETDLYRSNLSDVEPNRW